MLLFPVLHTPQPPSPENNNNNKNTPHRTHMAILFAYYVKPHG